MSNNFKDHIILYACVLTGIAILALAARTIAIGVGVDDFIATCTFWLAMLLGVSFYLIFERAFEKGVNIVIDKYFKPAHSTRGQLLQSCEEQPSELPDEKIEKLKEQIVQMEDFDEEDEDIFEEDDDDDYIEDEEATIPTVEPTPMLNLDKIRQNKAVQVSNELQERINVALLYTQHTLAPYMSDEAMADMLHNINVYATKGDKSELRAIHTRGLQYYDIFHYGWNIWNHFGVSQKQKAITIFLKAVFPHDLKNYDTLDGITRKLKMFVPNDTIKICENLTKQSN